MRGTQLIVSLAALFLLAYMTASVGQSSTAPEHKILVLRMQVSGNRHQMLEARVVPSSVALALPPASNQALEFLATDAKGALLLSGGLDDPLIVRAPLPLPGEPARNHEVIVRTEAQYLLRLPYQAKMKHVYVGKGMEINSGVSQQKLTTITQSPAVTVINLDEWLPAR